MSEISGLSVRPNALRPSLAFLALPPPWLCSPPSCTGLINLLCLPPGLQCPPPHPRSSNGHRRAACASSGAGSGGNDNHTTQPTAPAAIVAASAPPPPPALPSSHIRPPSRPASASAVPAVASSPRAMAHQPQGTSTPASEPQHRHSAAGSTHGQGQLQGQRQGQHQGQLQGQSQWQHAWAGTAAEESRGSPSAEPTQAQPHSRQAPGASASASGSHAASSARAQLYGRDASAKTRASHGAGYAQDQVPDQHVVPESAAACLRRPSSSPGAGYAQDGMQGQVVGRDAAGGSGKPPRALPGGGAGVGSWAVEGDRRSNGWAAGASSATRRGEESRGSGQGKDRDVAGLPAGFAAGGGGGGGGGGGDDDKERASLSSGAWQPGVQRVGGGAGQLAEGNEGAQAGGKRSGRHSGSVLAQRDVSGPGCVPSVDPARQRLCGSGANVATAGGRYGGGAPSSSGNSAVGGGRVGGGGGSSSTSSQRLVGPADAAYDAAVSISVTAGLRRRRRYRYDLKDESLNPHVMATRLIKAGLTPKVRASKPCSSFRMNLTVVGSRLRRGRWLQPTPCRCGHKKLTAGAL